MKRLKRIYIGYLFVLATFFSMELSGQQKNVPEATLRYGLIDRKGNPVISLQYEYISEPEYDVCYYTENGKVGLADTLLNILTPPNFEMLTIFENCIMVKSDNKWHFLEKKSFNEIGFEKYDNIEIKSWNHIAVRKDSHWGLVNDKGELSIPCLYEQIGDIDFGFVTARKEGKWGVLNTSGKELIPFVYEYTKFSERLRKLKWSVIKVWEKGKVKNKAGYCVIDTSGNRLLSELYDFIGLGGVHLLSVGNTAADYSDLRGFVNWAGEVVTPLVYTKTVECWYDGGGIAGVMNKCCTIDEYYYIDESGNIKLGPFKEIRESDYRGMYGIWGDGDFYDYSGNKIELPDDPVRYVSKDTSLVSPSKVLYSTVNPVTGLIGFEDEDGNTVIPQKYVHVDNFLYGDYTMAAKKNIFGSWKFGIINIEGKESVPIKYDFCSMNEHDRCILGKGRKMALSDVRENFLTPFAYDKIEFVVPGIYGIVRKGKYGLLSSSGREIIPCQYDNIYNFGLNYFFPEKEDALLTVKKGEKRGLVKQNTGEFVFPCLYDDIRQLPGEEAEKGKQKRLMAVKDGKCGIFTIDGRELVPCICNDFLVLKDGSLCARKESGWGLLDENYRPVTSFDYHSIHVFSNNYLIVSKDIN